MVTANPEEKVAEKIAFVMRVLKHTETSKPDWKAIAAEEGISRPGNAQQKFRRMVQDLGYDFVNDRIVDLGDGNVAAGGATADSKTNTSTTTTPTKKGKSPAKKGKATIGEERPSKKSKTSVPAPGSGGDGGEDQEI
ncbi:hypothetical protein PV04_00271 [Phialophora macrospora]|uniref:Myb-like DNA-binding domain-containing protein n=1 Tax=Phialophora macrospora TaxID=1851006 RepID=A0A0D2FUI9_9EURO|nr:hypothetical protein PV04_00271 [Phialophora macrospora]